MTRYRSAISGIVLSLAGTANAQDATTIPATAHFVEVEWKRTAPVVQTHYQAQPERMPMVVPVSLPAGVPACCPRCGLRLSR